MCFYTRPFPQPSPRQVSPPHLHSHRPWHTTRSKSGGASFLCSLSMCSNQSSRDGHSQPKMIGVPQSSLRNNPHSTREKTHPRIMSLGLHTPGCAKVSLTSLFRFLLATRHRGTPKAHLSGTPDVCCLRSLMISIPLLDIGRGCAGNPSPGMAPPKPG